jgi:hypothetical protein
MAETVKKTKAPAKPRKAAKKNEAVVEEIKVATPSREEIATLARKYWEERGWKDGYAEQDWLRAEQDLRGMAS